MRLSTIENHRFGDCVTAVPANNFGLSAITAQNSPAPATMHHDTITPTDRLVLRVLRAVIAAAMTVGMLGLAVQRGAARNQDERDADARVKTPSRHSGDAPADVQNPSRHSGDAPAYVQTPSRHSGDAPAYLQAPSRHSGDAPAYVQTPSRHSGDAPADVQAPSRHSGDAPAYLQTPSRHSGDTPADVQTPSRHRRSISSSNS
jgi:hypothetical protein